MPVVQNHLHVEVRLEDKPLTQLDLTLVSRAGPEPFNGVENRQVIDFIIRWVRTIRRIPGWGTRRAPARTIGLIVESRATISSCPAPYLNTSPPLACAVWLWVSVGGSLMLAPNFDTLSEQQCREVLADVVCRNCSDICWDGMVGASSWPS